MNAKTPENFSKYEIARILGARALQIAMDAPLLLKISEDELKAMKYDALKIAELEFSEGALPIAISRPLPRKGRDKLSEVKEDKTTDEEAIVKQQEVEKEITDEASELGFVQEDEAEEQGVTESAPSAEEE